MPGFTYKSYNFVDKDPIIDEIQFIFQNSGANFKWVEANSGVKSSTVSNWFSGKTKKPQAATANAVLRSLGYKLGIVEFGVKPVIVTLVEAKPASSMRHIIQIHKYNKKKSKASTRKPSSSSGRAITG